MTTESLESNPTSEKQSTPNSTFSFGLLLTVVAVFPLAYGVGQARLKTVAAKPAVTVQTVQNERVAKRESLPKRTQPVDRHQGDLLLKDGRFEAALQYYQSLGSTDRLRLPLELQFRIAACQEGLGLWEEAIVYDEGIATASAAEPLVSAALFAQARIRLRQNQPAQALPILRLLAKREHVPERIKRETDFLIPLSMLRQMTDEAETNTDLTADERYDLRPINDVLDWHMEAILEDLVDNEAKVFDGSQSREQVPQLPESIDNHWIADANAPSNMTEEPIELSQMLESVILAHPKERLVSHARFALGRLAQATGEHKLAVSHYSTLVGRAATPLAIRAAFNAAVSYYKLNDISNACDMLVQVVHGAPGHEVHARALILYGRLLLDQGEYREAAFQLQRATGTRMPPETQALASVYLGMAHLMRDNPRDAVESLFADKPNLVDGPVKNASAFFTSLARFRLLNGTMQEREATFLYRALIAIEDDADWLGPTGKLLIGQAMLSLGLGNKMFEHFQTSLNRDVLPVGIAQEMRFAMAENLLREKKTDEAELLLIDLSLNGEGKLLAKARFRLAEIALNANRPEDCIMTCRDLLETTTIDRQTLLKLAGRAFEQLGDNQRAAECYRGRMPKP